MGLFSSSKPRGPPPPPPPPPRGGQMIARQPSPPAITATRPPGALLLTLLIYNGAPFKDHWAYWIPSSARPYLGTYIHATGDVRSGFQLEIKRNYNMRTTNTKPLKQIPLQWITQDWLNEPAMLNHGSFKNDHIPCCPLEASLFKVQAPGKSLRDTDNMAGSAPGKITQRNCQTWIVESADQTVRDGALTGSVATYLRAIKQ